MNKIMLAALLALSAPAAALDDAQREAAYQLQIEISDVMNAGFEKDAFSPEQRAEAHRLFLAAADKARTGLAAYGEDAELARELQGDLGVALYYAADAFEYDPGDAAAQAEQVEWLSLSVASLGPLVEALGPIEAPVYEYRSGAAKLVELAGDTGEPRRAEWSAANVAGSRAMLARLASEGPENTRVERNQLAQALYREGWIAGDAAATAEADALAAELGDDLYSLTERMRDAVAEGGKPFPAPGEDYW